MIDAETKERHFREWLVKRGSEFPDERECELLKEAFLAGFEAAIEHESYWRD